MGCAKSKPITEGAVIVDSVVISNSRARFHGDMIQLPIKSLASGESSVITIDKKGGVVRITRGPIHGVLSHDQLCEEIEFDDMLKKRSPRRSTTIHKENIKL